MLPRVLHEDGDLGFVRRVRRPIPADQGHDLVLHDRHGIEGHRQLQRPLAPAARRRGQLQTNPVKRLGFHAEVGPDDGIAELLRGFPYIDIPNQFSNMAAV